MKKRPALPPCSRLLPLPLFLAGSAIALAAPAPERPNIVFILADDTGIDGYGCYGSDRFKDKTPNIDALAASGIRFDYCYSMPVCNPSRNALMTGRYGFHTGNQPKSADEPSVARTLKQAGYATGMAGKWRQQKESPLLWGFDEAFSDNTASGWYWETEYLKNDQPFKAKPGSYGPDLCRDYTIDFFERHRDKPFFFYYSTHLVHNPILRTPDSPSKNKENDPLYEDNMKYLDRQVGELVAALDRLGLLEKTIIVFSGDNGTAHFGSPHSYIRGRKVYGEKQTMFEGGSRVPMIVSWKGRLPGKRVCADLVDFSDVHPTFAEFGDAPLPADRPPVDGRSFAPQVFGKPATPRDWIYVQHNTLHEWYVLEKGWKLTQEGKLYDMSDAPYAEKLVPVEKQSPAAKAARARLQVALDKLSPSTGKLTDPKDLTPEAREKRKQKRKQMAEKAAAEKAGAEKNAGQTKQPKAPAKQK